MLSVPNSPVPATGSSWKRPHGNKADTYSAILSDDGATWTGGNLMGRLLMELRDNGKLEYHLPEDAMRFSDLLEP